MVTNKSSGRTWFGPIIVQRTFLFTNRTFLVVTSCLEFSAYRWFFLWGNILRKLKLTAQLHLVPSHERRGGKLQLHNIQLQYYFIATLRQSDLHQFQAVILEDCPSVPTGISPLRPRGNFMYLKFYTSTKYKYCITACLCVPYDYQNREKIFPYTAKHVPYYKRYGECLCAVRFDYL